MLDAGALLTLGAYFHDLHPELVRLGPVVIRWYGLSYIAGFVVAYALMVWMARRGRIHLPAHRVGDAMLWLIVGTIAGGRLGYALVYDPALLTGFRSAFPYWDLLALHNGGMASHGGMVGLALAAWRIAQGFKVADGPDGGAHAGTIEGRSTLAHTSDVLCLVAPFGIFFGRLANFINGELLGRIVAMPGQPAPWWAVRYPQELLSGQAPALSPEQAVALEKLVAQVAAPAPIATEGAWRAGLERLVASAGQHRAQLEPLLSARHPSQLYQALAEGVVLALVVWAIAWRRVHAGIVTGAWLMTYGALRVLTEFWRLPDAQFAVGRPGGLSRGQWLSVAMVAVGGLVLAWAVRASRRKTDADKHLGVGV
jgi:phosphatidylglycerol:prolipoprotein diacylglycerol transferase